MKVDCWFKDRKVNYAEEVNGESKLFMAHSNTLDIHGGVWFVDNRCSNHMTGKMSLFKELDESQKKRVTLGDDKEIQVEGKGTVAITTSQGKTKLLHDV